MGNCEHGGACELYNADRFRHIYFGLAMSIKVLGLVFISIAAYFSTQRDRKDSLDTSVNRHIDTMNINASSSNIRKDDNKNQQLNSSIIVGGGTGGGSTSSTSLQPQNSLQQSSLRANSPLSASLSTGRQFHHQFQNSYPDSTLGGIQEES